jgi:hypothetical protein
MRKLIGLALLLLVATLANAGGLSPTAKTEIDALLNKLATSECQFYRNGSWHTGAEAKDHLQMKLDYLVKRGRIASAEEFIEKAGSKSSISGQTYQVRCPNQEAQPSAVWLGNELRRIRGEGARP